jgi:L-ribulokinase
MVMDWFHGCRTPLMDGGLTGAVLGLTLETRAEQVYRATLEASAMGLRWIVDTLREGGVPVDRFVATGGLASKNPLFAKIAASVLGATIEIHPAEQGPALGAAILGALAAGAFGDAREAVECMAGARSALGPSRRAEPEGEWVRVYEGLYRRYRRLAEQMAGRGSS